MGLIQNVKIYWRLRPLLDESTKLLQVGWSWQVAISFVLLVLQAIIWLDDVFPPKYKWVPVVAHLVVEFAMKVIAQFRNPDGKPVTLPWVPPAALPEKKE